MSQRAVFERRRNMGDKWPIYIAPQGTSIPSATPMQQDTFPTVVKVTEKDSLQHRLGNEPEGGPPRHMTVPCKSSSLIRPPYAKPVEPSSSSTDDDRYSMSPHPPGHEPTSPALGDDSLTTTMFATSPEEVPPLAPLFVDPTPLPQNSSDPHETAQAAVSHEDVHDATSSQHISDSPHHTIYPTQGTAIIPMGEIDVSSVPYSTVPSEDGYISPYYSPASSYPMVNSAEPPSLPPSMSPSSSPISYSVPISHGDNHPPRQSFTTSSMSGYIPIFSESQLNFGRTSANTAVVNAADNEASSSPVHLDQSAGPWQARADGQYTHSHLSSPAHQTHVASSQGFVFLQADQTPHQAVVYQHNNAITRSEHSYYAQDFPAAYRPQNHATAPQYHNSLVVNEYYLPPHHAYYPAQSAPPPSYSEYLSQTISHAVHTESSSPELSIAAQLRGGVEDIPQEQTAYAALRLAGSQTSPGEQHILAEPPTAAVHVYNPLPPPHFRRHASYLQRKNTASESDFAEDSHCPLPDVPAGVPQVFFSTSMAAHHTHPQVFTHPVNDNPVDIIGQEGWYSSSGLSLSKTNIDSESLHNPFTDTHLSDRTNTSLAIYSNSTEVHSHALPESSPVAVTPYDQSLEYYSPQYTAPAGAQQIFMPPPSSAAGYQQPDMLLDHADATALHEDHYAGDGLRKHINSLSTSAFYQATNLSVFPSVYTAGAAVENMGATETRNLASAPGRVTLSRSTRDRRIVMGVGSSKVSEPHAGTRNMSNHPNTPVSLPPYWLDIAQEQVRHGVPDNRGLVHPKETVYHNDIKGNTLAHLGMRFGLPYLQPHTLHSTDKPISLPMDISSSTGDHW
ncbi:hypothetical protein C8Q80DRAFT_1284069 [Daedaleopsis nitida]|nr:hypothetical protein C8Q80DRAFT_1284069 [Daedaleopsis nitida]